MLCNLLANLVIILQDIQRLIFTTHIRLEIKPNPVKLKDGLHGVYQLCTATDFAH